PARERRGARGPRERPSRGPGQSPRTPRRARRACEGAARGTGPPRATEPGSGAEPRLRRTDGLRTSAQPWDAAACDLADPVWPQRHGRDWPAAATDVGAGADHGNPDSRRAINAVRWMIGAAVFATAL